MISVKKNSDASKYTMKVKHTMKAKRKSTPKQAVIYDDFVAGLKYYDVGSIEIEVGQRLRMFWERSNQADNKAIRIETTDGVKLGYVKAKDTHKLHWYLERGIKLQATVAGWFSRNPSWEMLRFKVTAPNSINTNEDTEL